MAQNTAMYALDRTDGFGGIGCIGSGVATIVVLVSAALFVVVSDAAGALGEALISVMTAAVLYGLFAWLRVAWLVSREMAVMRHVFGELGRHPIDAVLAAHNGMRSGTIDVLRSLTRQTRVDAGSISPVAAQQKLRDDLAIRNAGVSHWSGLLGQLGVVGTTCGMILTLDDIGVAMRSDEASIGPAFVQTLFEPGGPLVGLGTALITTLLGAVYGGLVLRRLAFSNQCAIVRLCGQLERLVDTYAAPDLRRQAREGGDVQQKGD